MYSVKNLLRAGSVPCGPFPERAPSHLLIYRKEKMAVNAVLIRKTGNFYFLARQLKMHIL